MGLFSKTPKDRANTVSGHWKEIRELLDRNEDFYLERREEIGDIGRGMATLIHPSREITLELTDTLLRNIGHVITGMKGKYESDVIKRITGLNQEIIGELNLIDDSLRK